MDSGGPNEACIKWGPDRPCKRAIIRGKDMPGNVPQHSGMSCAKITEPIDLWFGMWSRGKKAQLQLYLPGCATVSSWEGTLAQRGNTTEPSVCGGDVVLCHITLTTCYICLNILFDAEHWTA